jgi:MarR family transcriptional regulator for hemolysin
LNASLEQRFCLDLLRAARAWRRIADAAAVEFGLSEATAYPLVFMSRLGEGLRQTTLAEAIGIEGPSLVRVLDQLCAGGLVERREDPTDRRAKTLHLTEKGRRTARDLTARLDETRARVFAAADPGDLRAGLRVFEIIEGTANRTAAPAAGELVQ